MTDVPVLRVFIKWDVGALCTTVGGSLVPSSLLTVSTDTTGKQKHRLPLQRYGGGSQVSELSLFSPCLKVHGFFLVLALYLNDLLYPGNLHGNLHAVVSSCCSIISLSSTAKALSIRL